MTMVVHSNSPSELQSVLKKPSDSVRIQKICSHCQASFEGFRSQILQPAKQNGQGDTETFFCCKGCEAAWRLIRGLGLDSFYEMYAASQLGKPLAAVSNRSFDYKIYDSEEFQSAFVTNVFDDDPDQIGSSKAEEAGQFEKKANLMIDGIACYACVWLIQKGLDRRFRLDAHSGRAVSVSINQTTGIGQVTYNSRHVQLSKIIEFIEALGYTVAPNRLGSFKADHSEVIRVGVGLFLMLNVMSFATAEYFAGADGLNRELELMIRWLSLVMTMIAMMWPGREFFISSWRTLVHRSPGIDAPIALGLLAAFIWSARSTILGEGAVYYDSITAIIALVMTGRLVQKNVIRRNQSKMAALLNPSDGWTLVAYQSEEGCRWKPTRATQVRKGDRVRLLPGEMLPIRGLCFSDCASISFDQLRGEAGWRNVIKGENIPAGAVNGHVPIEVIADQDGRDSYTESLAHSIERVMTEKGSYHQWSDRAARVLFAVVLVSALIVAWVVGRHDAQDAISRIVAMLLVACPCTFAIGVPLVYGSAMMRALQDGVLFKSQRAIEVLGRIKHLVFDKTGTLTEGLLSVKDIRWNDRVSDELKGTILRYLSTADQSSNHHIPQAIAKFSRRSGFSSLVTSDSVTEEMSAGMIMKFGSDKLLIGSVKFIASNVDFFDQDKWGKETNLIALNNIVVAAVETEDAIRTNAKDLIKSLKISGSKIELLSGDSSVKTLLAAQQLDLEGPAAHGEATPASKMLFIRKAAQDHGVAMIGNGLNDSGAMAQADVAIAVDRASTRAVNSADVCLLRADISLVDLAIKYALIARRRIRLVFVVAAVYNLIGVYLAARGLVSPVVAAVLMPISSLTVTYLSTAWKVKKNLV